MTTKAIHTAAIILGEWTYELEFLNSHEVLLRLKNPPWSSFDHWDDHGDEFTRTYRGDRVITLTRWVIREIESYLKRHKPPFIFYTLGFDFSRYRLYRRVGLGFKKIGYDLAHMPNTGGFYLYKTPI